MFTKDTPAWIVFGGLALAGGAGCINAVGFLGLHHQALTHVTGTVSILSLEVVEGDSVMAARALFMIVSFFLGAFLSGVIIRQSTLRLGRRYGAALAIESALLFAAVYFLHRGAFAGDYLASMACGLQNAMATSYSGAVIRTTHLTGVVTDLGIACGHWVRGQPVNWGRFRLYGVLVSGFFLGGVLGAILYRQIGYNALLLPAGVTGFAGLFYAAYKHHVRGREGRKTG